MHFAALASLALFAAAPVAAQPLTVPAGETWIFSLQQGQPTKAHKADPSAKLARGEIKVSVLTLMGTTMTATSNGPDAYKFRAELIGPNGNAVPARTCTLPSGGRPALESWPQKATAVRVSDFRPAVDPGSC
jgi:hypothetical protein